MSTYDDLDEPRHSTPGVLVSKPDIFSLASRRAFCERHYPWRSKPYRYEPGQDFAWPLTIYSIRSKNLSKACPSSHPLVTSVTTAIVNELLQTDRFLRNTRRHFDAAFHVVSSSALSTDRSSIFIFLLPYKQCPNHWAMIDEPI